MKILPGDFENPQVRRLLETHLAGMREASPPENVFALDLSGLQAPDISFFTAWDGENLTGMGALKHLSSEAGEIKSMRTHPQHLRRGVAVAVLEHILATARSRGYQSLSLETGSGPAFEPALKLYHRYGFTSGAAFAEYKPSDFSQFLHLNL